MMQSTICFVSDFGIGDTWVGVCHAVIHAACPQSHVVDLDHTVPAFDIRKGAAVTAAGVYQLPGAIHLAVVDPGVGGGRKDLCLIAVDGTRLVGPDNGLLMPAATRAGGIAQAVAIDPSKVGARRPQPTFHARDVLAPAAAALACGVAPHALGDPIEPSVLVPAPFVPGRVEGESILGEVVECDRFGSVRFNVTAADLNGIMPDREPRTIELAIGHNTLVVPYRRTYGDVALDDPVALIDSSGWLTLSVNSGDAYDRYGVSVSQPVRIHVIE